MWTVEYHPECYGGGVELSFTNFSKVLNFGKVVLKKTDLANWKKLFFTTFQIKTIIFFSKRYLYR